jgi:DNA-binding Xre family transcriptional regulator
LEDLRFTTSKSYVLGPRGAIGVRVLFAFDAWRAAVRLAERRTALGRSQTDVADRMGVTKSRVSLIERGEVSTVEVIARYVEVLCGHLQVSAAFGDDMYVLRGADTYAAWGTRGFGYASSSGHSKV